jgi:hypothetical protein
MTISPKQPLQTMKQETNNQKAYYPMKDTVMKYYIPIEQLIPATRHSSHRLSWRRAFSITRLYCVAACLTLSPLAKAACEQGCDTTHLNTFLGDNTLINNTSGIDNVAVGVGALRYNSNGNNDTGVGAYALTANTTGSNDTAVGYSSMNVGSGLDNTAVGAYSLITCTGNDNTATGSNAMGQATVSGSNNTADGYRALYSNTSGNNNTASGYEALFSDQTGGSNTAVGVFSLYFNTGGNYNTATGRGALYKNTASSNTATGYQSLNNNSSGTYNTADGTRTLAANTTANYNTALGYQALNASTGSTNTALGANALPASTTGSNNIAIGSAAGLYVTTGSNNIEIGSSGTAESSTTRLGTPGLQANTYISGIYGVTVPGGIGMIVDSTGHLGTSTSSARFKENIKQMDKASEAVFALQPVTFRYKHELDPQGIPQFGLVAEQVEKVNPDLVARDDQGKPCTVRYEAVNAMLLNEFLKEHSKVAEQTSINRQQEATIMGLKAMLAEQQKEIKTLKAGLERVTDRLDATRPAGRLVTNNK